MVIEKDQMMDLLIEECPWFEPTWREFCHEWKDETEIPLYVALADFNRQLERMSRERNVENFQAVFGLIERLVREGDDYVRKAAIIGILESLQSSEEASSIAQYLGPESTRWWDKLNSFWDGDPRAFLDD